MFSFGAFLICLILCLFVTGVTAKNDSSSVAPASITPTPPQGYVLATGWLPIPWVTGGGNAPYQLLQIPSVQCGVGTSPHVSIAMNMTTTYTGSDLRYTYMSLFLWSQRNSIFDGADWSDRTGLARILTIHYNNQPEAINPSVPSAGYQIGVFTWEGDSSGDTGSNNALSWTLYCIPSRY